MKKQVFVNTFACVLALFVGHIDMCFADHAAKFPRVDKRIAEYDASLNEMRRKFGQIPENLKDVEWVKQKLEFMVDIDQFMREQIKWPKLDQWTEEEKQYFWQQFLPRWSELDSRNTDELKTLLKIYPWFTVTQFGVQGDQNAWLIVQHSDHDVAFQKSVLPVLEGLYPRGETSAKNYGYLYDRIAMNEETPQLYGTQGECRKEGWVPVPEIADFENVDIRRSSLGMDTFAENKRRMDQVCAQF